MSGDAACGHRARVLWQGSWQFLRELCRFWLFGAGIGALTLRSVGEQPGFWPAPLQRQRCTPHASALGTSVEQTESRTKAMWTFSERHGGSHTTIVTSRRTSPDDAFGQNRVRFARDGQACLLLVGRPSRHSSHDASRLAGWSGHYGPRVALISAGCGGREHNGGDAVCTDATPSGEADEAISASWSLRRAIGETGSRASVSEDIRVADRAKANHFGTIRRRTPRHFGVEARRAQSLRRCGREELSSHGAGCLQPSSDCALLPSAPSGAVW